MERLHTKSYEYKMISKGSNFPSINLSKGNYGVICIMLHERSSLNKIQEVLSISDATFNKKMGRLLQEGLIKKISNDKYLPTFPIISLEEGAEMYKHSKELGSEIVNIIKNDINNIIEETYKIPALSTFHFEDISLFILSDVILDFIQIENVEKHFLKKERPNRNNKFYYYTIMEKNPNSHIEACGIFGNHCEEYGEKQFCIYGKERYTTKNFITLTEDEAAKLLGPNETKHYKNQLIDKIVDFNNGENRLTSQTKKGLEKLDIISNDKVLIPIFSKTEYLSLYNIAGVITEKLINVLNSYMPFMVKIYNSTLYSEETSFEEYFIWYYHILYSYVTEQLINEGHIIMPKGRVFNYIIRY